MRIDGAARQNLIGLLDYVVRLDERVAFGSWDIGCVRDHADAQPALHTVIYDEAAASSFGRCPGPASFPCSMAHLWRDQASGIAREQQAKSWERGDEPTIFSLRSTDGSPKVSTLADTLQSE